MVYNKWYYIHEIFMNVYMSMKNKYLHYIVLFSVQLSQNFDEKMKADSKFYVVSFYLDN